MSADDAERGAGNRRGQLAGLAFLLAAVLVGVLVASGALSGDDPAEEASLVGGVRGTEETTRLLHGVPQRGLVLGRPDAPVTVVEFVDAKCPFCRSFVLEEGPRVVADLVRTGRANVELRVLANLGPDSQVARNAIHGLASRGRAWTLAELLFYNQGPETTEWVTPELLARIGRTAPELRGLPVPATPTPASRRLDAETDALAERLDLQGTPAIYVRPRDRTDAGAHREVSLRGTGSDAGKVASAVDDLDG